MVALVFQFVFLGQRVAEQPQGFVGGRSRKHDMMFRRNPHKTELVLEQNELAFDEAIVFESLSGDLTPTWKSLKIPLTTFAGQLDRGKGRRIARRKVDREGCLSSGDIAIPRNLAGKQCVICVGDVDDLGSMFAVTVQGKRPET